jgi:hypothetical protein
MAMLRHRVESDFILTEEEVADLREEFRVDDLNDIDPKAAAKFLGLADDYVLDALDYEDWDW